MTVASRSVARRIRRHMGRAAKDAVDTRMVRYERRTVTEVFSGTDGRGGTATVVDGLGQSSYGIRWFSHRPEVTDVVLVEIPPPGGTRRIVDIDRDLGSESGNPHQSPIFDSRDFGAKGDGSTVDTSALQDALTTIGKLGGGILYGAPGGTHLIDAALLIEYSNVRFDLNGSTLVRYGTSTAPLVWIRTPDGQSAKIRGSGISNGALDFGDALYAIRITTANRSIVEDLDIVGGLDSSSAWAIYSNCWDVRPSGGDARDNQHTAIRDVRIRVLGATNGLRLHGNSDAAVEAGNGANTSLNELSNIFISTVNGDAYSFGNADGNISILLRSNSTGTGKGIVLNGSSSPTGKGAARHNQFVGCQPTNGLYSLPGTTNAGEPDPNTALGYSLGNGTPDPAITSGVGTFYWIGDDGVSGNWPTMVPAGGTSGQQLTKSSNTDFDLEWAAAGGGGGLSDGDYGDVVVSSSGTVMHVESAVGTFALSGASTASTATGNITALSITNTRLRWAGAGAATLCGIAAGSIGRVVLIHNTSTTQSLTLAHESGSEATTGNRLFCPGSVDLILGPNASVWVAYETNANRWRVIARRTAIADIDGLATVATSGSASDLSAGTLPTARSGALTGDVTKSAGSSATTLAAGSASNLNSGTLQDARMPALTGDVTTAAGAVATTIAARAVTAAKLFAASATARFLLRKTASGGDWEEGTAADAKTILAIAQADVSGLTTASTPTFAGVTANAGRLRMSSALSPAQITGDQNDYTPTGFDGTINVLKITLDVAHNLTGLLAGSEGDLLIINNLTTSSGTATLKNESASSSANNRFHGRNSADLALNAGGAVMLAYLGNRWRILST